MKKKRIFWTVALIGLILDQVTKYVVVQNFADIGDSFPLWKNIFHFTYIINTGAAFSFFRGGVIWLRWLSLIVSLGLIVPTVWRYRLSPCIDRNYLWFRAISYVSSRC